MATTPTTNSISLQVAAARRAFDSGRTKGFGWRRTQLEALQRMIEGNTAAIRGAVHRDLGKSVVEANITEVSSVVAEVKLARKKLVRWTRDRRVSSPLTLGRAHAFIHREPLGVVTIIGPWNYPVNLVLTPLIGAIAAGNAAVVKPSELAPNSSALVARLIPQYLDAEAIQVVEGGVPETTELLAQRVDHIFYTGNGTVGAVILAAVAPSLTPVTLELGGKSPVWVDASADLERSAASIAWGKFSNCGQTCVAPDYVLATADVAESLARAVAAKIPEYYGPDPKTSPDYGRIINERHAQRLAGLLDSGTVIAGGTADVANRYVAPTVLFDVPADSPAMRDEIFGPILPVVVVPDLDAAISFVNERPHPLALYAFTKEASVRRRWTDETTSGGLAFGTVMVQLGVPELPFGGVGASGTGAYHGEHSVRIFSHERAVLRMLPGPDLTALVRPPFTTRKTKMLMGR